MSEAKKEYYKNNPEAKKKTSEVGKEYYKNNPEAKKKTSEAGKNTIKIILKQQRK